MNTRVCLNIIFTIAIRWIVVLEGIYYLIRGELKGKFQQIYIFLLYWRVLSKHFFLWCDCLVFLLGEANLFSFICLAPSFQVYAKHFIYLKIGQFIYHERRTYTKNKHLILMMKIRLYLQNMHNFVWMQRWRKLIPWYNHRLGNIETIHWKCQ